MGLDLLCSFSNSDMWSLSNIFDIHFRNRSKLPFKVPAES